MNKNISLKGGRVAVCAIFKDECTYVLEWLSHHRLVGINDFYIADNISSDGTSQLLEALHNDKVLTRLVWPTIPGTKPQLSAYEKLAELAKNDGVDWVLFIDADEFVMLDDKYSNIQSFIHEITTRDSKIAGITINWSTYGSSNLIINPDNEVLCNFEFRFKKDSAINRHYKSMIKLDAFISPGNTPHEFKIDPTLKYVNSVGTEHILPLSGMSSAVTWENIKINHYMIKSKSEYISKKMRKGRASSNANLDMTYFYGHDVNDEFSPLIRSWVRLVQHYKKNLEVKYLLEKPKYENGPLYFYANKNHIGSIDSINLIDGKTLEINGWALGDNGEAPLCFRVIKDGYRDANIKSVQLKSRPDVLSKIDLCENERCGFSIQCDVIENESLDFISVYYGNNSNIATGCVNHNIK